MPAGVNVDRAREVYELGEWDWWHFWGGRVLHAATVLYDAEYDPHGEGTTACGRSGWLSIPGIFTRMEAPRCVVCCKKMGYPLGTGSPKNDDACRLLVKRRLKAAVLV